MKKRRFYDNKGRGEKWTEPPVGRKIYFADKYITPDGDSQKPENDKRTKKPFFTRERYEKVLKFLIVTVGCLAIMGLGYTVMDIHLERNAMPVSSGDGEDGAGIGSVSLRIKAADCQPLSLDGGVMLDAITEKASGSGYSCLAFDLKRRDGTIGYQSKLATVDAYGAISSPAGDLNGSVKILKENDILPVGKISCYKDGIAPAADLTCALSDAGGLYKDNAGNTYLNPDSENAYNYIKGIVEEALSAGISVFVLDNYDLPEEAGVQGGFDKISRRLYADFGREIKIFKGISLDISSDDEKSTAKEWSEETDDFKSEKDSVVFCVTAKNPSVLKQYLDASTSDNYIILE